MIDHQFSKHPSINQDDLGTTAARDAGRPTAHAAPLALQSPDFLAEHSLAHTFDTLKYYARWTPSGNINHVWVLEGTLVWTPRPAIVQEGALIAT